MRLDSLSRMEFEAMNGDCPETGIRLDLTGAAGIDVGDKINIVNFHLGRYSTPWWAIRAYSAAASWKTLLRQPPLPMRSYSSSFFYQAW